MALVVTGQAHHHGQAVGDVQHRVQHGQLLGVVQRRGLAGAAHDQAVNAGRGVVAHQRRSAPPSTAPPENGVTRGIQMPWNGDV